MGMKPDNWTEDMAATPENLKNIEEYLKRILEPTEWIVSTLGEEEGTIFFSTPEEIPFFWYLDRGCAFGPSTSVFYKPKSAVKFVLRAKGDLRGLVAKGYLGLKNNFYCALSNDLSGWTEDNPILKKALTEYVPENETQRLAKIVLLGSPSDEELRSVYRIISSRSSYLETVSERNPWYSLILSKLAKDQSVSSK